MRTSLVCFLLLTLAAASLALTPAIAPTPPPKAPAIADAPPPDPAVIRQGGDTIADATVVVSLPYNDTGTTDGYTDDYDHACPYEGSTSPDVVYAFTPTVDLVAVIDLCGSSYDTKIWVYDSALEVIACNDDYYVPGDPCGDYVSKLENVPMQAGMTYYWIIDGYGGEFGDYVLSAEIFDPGVPCVLECPPGGVPEGEPPLQDDQINDFNDGCSSVNPDGFQDISGDAAGSLIRCGTSGGFLYQGAKYRDTDWFVATFGPDGIIELTADAEWPLFVFELGPQNCDEVGVVQNISVGPCETASMTVIGEPFATVWLWTGPTEFASPDGTTPYEYDYIIWLSGLAPGTVANESATWSGVKTLFR